MCVSLYIYIKYVRVCLRLDIGYAVLIRLACVCEYGCACVCVYHVEHQDKRIRRGVGVRAGGSQGRRELQAAADNELVTETCAIRRN